MTKLTVLKNLDIVNIILLYLDDINSKINFLSIMKYYRCNLDFFRYLKEFLCYIFKINRKMIRIDPFEFPLLTRSEILYINKQNDKINILLKDYLKLFSRYYDNGVIIRYNFVYSNLYCFIRILNYCGNPNIPIEEEYYYMTDKYKKLSEK